MRKTALLISVLLLLSSGYGLAQNPFRFGGQKPFLGMKGKVKTSTEQTFDLKWENDEVVEELKGKAVFEFTKKGELKKKTTSYDDYVKSITYSEYEDGRAMRFEQEITESASLDRDSSRIFIVDNKNERLVTWRNYNHEYTDVDTTLIRYMGDITEITPLSNWRKLQIDETRDRRGNLVRETRSLRGKRASWCDWVYDENDLLVEESGTKPGGFGMMDDYSYFYEYDDFDKRGNWRRKVVKVRKNQYEEDSEMVTTTIIRRQIKYY